MCEGMPKQLCGFRHSKKILPRDIVGEWEAFNSMEKNTQNLDDRVDGDDFCLMNPWVCLDLFFFIIEILNMMKLFVVVGN